MCAPSLSWSLVAQIATIALLVILVIDLFLRYLNNDEKGLFP